MKSTLMFLAITGLVSLSVSSFAQSTNPPASPATPAESTEQEGGKELVSEKMVTFFDLVATDGQGTLHPLKDFRGKVVLAANTASKCGFTPQYKQLQALHDKYAGQGFTVLGFPSNDFLKQEPGTDAEIKSFCEVNYGVKFPLFQKLPVTGEKKQPVFAFLTEKGPADTRGEVKWNFEKFVINRKGQVVARFPSKVTPDDPKVIAALESALSEKAPTFSKPPAKDIKAKKN